MSLQLLPSGCFEITLKDGSIVKGQFNAATLKKLSLMNGGVGFSDTLDLITTKASITNYLQFVLCATEGGFTEFDVLEWVEQMGGFDSDEFQKLIAHFMDGFVSKKKETEIV